MNLNFKPFNIYFLKLTLTFILILATNHYLHSLVVILKYKTFKNKQYLNLHTYRFGTDDYDNILNHIRYK